MTDDRTHPPPPPPPLPPPSWTGPPSQPSPPTKPTRPSAWYMQNWFVILSLIVVFPLGLTLMWLRRPAWTLSARWITTAAVVGVWALLIAVSAAAAPPRVPAVRGGPVNPPASIDAPTSTSTPTATPTPTPTATSTPAPTPLPTPVPTPTPRPAPPPPTAQPVNLCGAPSNPWGYNFCGGGLIDSPDPSFCDYFNCIPSFWQSTNGYVVQCVDGTFSHSGGRSGACSYHSGEGRPLYQ